MSNKKSIDFFERPLPSDEEVANFEELISKEAVADKGREIKDELLEIYEDADGHIIDVKKINIKRGRSRLAGFLRNSILILIVAALAYGAYIYFWRARFGDNLLELKVSSPTVAASGEDFFYDINYKNLSGSDLKSLKIEVTYPDNFIFAESLPAPSTNKNTWEIDNLASQASGLIRIKGKIINSDGVDNLISVKVNYYLAGFSTEFKNEATAILTTRGYGFNLDTSYASSAFVNEDNEIDLNFSNYQSPPAPEMILTVNSSSTLDIAALLPLSGDNTYLTATNIGDNSWKLTGFDQKIDRQSLKFKYRLKDLNINNLQIDLSLAIRGDDNQNYIFWQKSLTPEVSQNSLNLSLAVNDNKGDSAVNFGDTLNYSLTYNNKGGSDLKNVVIMAVVDGDLLNWNGLIDKNRGDSKIGSITWTANEIPALRTISAGSGGEIDFSIPIKKFDSADLGKKFIVTSYAQFSVGNDSSSNAGIDNKSNTVLNKINSDLSFNEQVRYFNQDNLPVGSGPLPPKVGQKTSLKVYWTLENNLHPLNNVQTAFNLPLGVEFDGQSKADSGSLYYDAANRQIIWKIDTWPANVYNLKAEFNIALTPQTSDRNRIMILSTGSAVTAIDSETQSQIVKTVKAQTTKLDDDDIATLNNDGRIQ